MGERRPLSVIFLPYSREQKTPSYLPYRGWANNSHQAWWSHFTFVAPISLLQEAVCLLKKYPHFSFFFCEVTLVFCPITAAQRTRCQRTSGLPRTLQIIWGLQVLIKKVPSCFNTEIGIFFLLCPWTLLLHDHCKLLLQLGILRSRVFEPHCSFVLWIVELQWTT